jgi:hypothetical protein
MAGVSILLGEQNARAALETADFGCVLETGEVVQSGPAQILIHDPKLVAAYFGECGSRQTAFVQIAALERARNSWTILQVRLAASSRDA